MRYNSSSLKYLSSVIILTEVTTQYFPQLHLPVLVNTSKYTSNVFFHLFFPLRKSKIKLSGKFPEFF